MLRIKITSGKMSLAVIAILPARDDDGFSCGYSEK